MLSASAAWYGLLYAAAPASLLLAVMQWLPPYGRMCRGNSEVTVDREIPQCGATASERVVSAWTTPALLSRCTCCMQSTKNGLSLVVDAEPAYTVIQARCESVRVLVRRLNL